MPRTLLLLALTLAVIAATGCTLGFVTPAVPGQVRPTLDAWTDAGMACTGPTKDNVPNGMLAWSCRGNLEGVEISGDLQGDDQGVFGFQVVVPAATESDAARDTFSGLIDATPPLDGLEADIVQFIDGWPGIDAVGSFGDTRVRVEVDSIWRVLTVSPGPRHTVDDATP